MRTLIQMTAIGMLTLTAPSVVWSAEDITEIDFAQTLDALLPAMGSDDVGARQDAQQKWQAVCFQAGAPGNGGERKQVCRLMAAKLGTDLPVPARVWLLTQLEYIGRSECVGAVAQALNHPQVKVSDAARRALARIPVARAGEVLANELQKATDAEQKTALIGALGYRAEPTHVPVLGRFLANEDTAIAIAATRALAKIATPEAARRLNEARADAAGELRLRILDAYLTCADRMLAAGKRDEAAAIYETIRHSQAPVRLAALTGLIATAGDRACSVILEVLAGQDKAAQAIAVRGVEEADYRVIGPLVAGLPKLPPPGRALAIRALGTRLAKMESSPNRRQARQTVLPLIMNALEEDDPTLRQAAVAALGGIGDASTVPVLVRLTLAGDEWSAAARTSLEAVDGDNVDQTLVNIMKETSDSGQRRTLIDILSSRRAGSAVPALLDEAVSDDQAVRRTAMAALGRIAGPEHIAGMIRGMWETEGGDRDHAERAITSVCARISDGDDQAGPVMVVYNRSDDLQKNGILSLLGRIGSPDALETIRKELDDDDTDRYEAAVRAIANWPNSAVAEDLLKLAETGRGEAQRISALRALARVAVRRGELPEKEQLEFLMRGMKLATRIDEKRLILDRAKAIRQIEALQFVVPYLDQPDLAEPACRAVVELARDTGFRNRHKDDFRAALIKVKQTTKDRGLAERAQSRMPD